MTLDGGIAARRLVAQGLGGTPLGSPADAVRHLVAVQSQDYAGATWALAQRLPGWTRADIDRAFDAGELLAGGGLRRRRRRQRSSSNRLCPWLRRTARRSPGRWRPTRPTPAECSR